MLTGTVAGLAAGSWIRRPMSIHRRGAWRAGPFRFWFWFFFQKNSPWRFGPSRRGPGRTREDPGGISIPTFSLKMAQDGVQDVSKTAKMASKTAKMAPRCLQDGPSDIGHRPASCTAWVPQGGAEAPMNCK